MAHIPLQAPFMHQRTKHRVFDATIVTKIAQISKGREDYYIAPRKKKPLWRPFRPLGRACKADVGLGVA